MDVENLVDIFSAEILRNRADLKDFSKGSVLYTLARAVALTVNEVYAEIKDLSNSSLLFSDNLNEDLILSLFPNLTRREGTLASGFVLVTNLDSSIVSLPINTPLTDPVSSNQYITTQNATIDNISETQVSIVAIDKGAQYNIASGRRLINVNYPRLIFTTGKYREIDNTIVGDIIGGTSDESLSEFQTRLQNRLLNSRVNSQQLVIDYLLSQENITNVSIENLRGGLVLIWVSSTTVLYSNDLLTLNNNIKQYLPIGIYSEIRQLINIPVSIRLQLFESSSVLLDKLIVELITNYINELPPSSSLLISNLRNLISERVGIIPKILEPTNSLTLTNFQKFQVTSVEIINVS